VWPGGRGDEVGEPADRASYLLLDDAADCGGFDEEQPGDAGVVDDGVPSSVPDTCWNAATNSSA
jgi:hypothetical protein